MKPGKPGKWARFNAGTRRTPGAMNKTEQAFAAWLDARPEAERWVFDQLTLRYGKRLGYTPDFVVLLKDGTVEVWEVKGSQGWLLDSESRTKWKAGAESFLGGLFTFRAAVKQTKKAGGGWKLESYERVTPWP